MEPEMSFITWSISLGTIVELCSILLGGAVFVSTVHRRMDKIDTELEKVRELLTKTAVMDSRLVAIEADIREMRHGRGFIVQPPM